MASTAVNLLKRTFSLAGATLAMVPMMVIYLIFQRQFIEGIALTGLKG